jgi:hypothetical protein
MLDLNTLIDPALGTLVMATGINDAGQIIANDSTDGGHAYLLTPVPEPLTGSLLGIGLLGIGLTVRLRVRFLRTRFLRTNGTRV